MSIGAPSIFQKGFSKNITSHYLSFLDLIDARKIPKVCRVWSLTYKECADERYWISQCNKQNVPQDSIGAVAYGLETVVGKYFSEDGVEPSKSRRCWKIVRLIAEYAPDCMFEVKALIISGRISFDRLGCHVFAKNRNKYVHRWGTDESEAIVGVGYTSDTNERPKEWSMRQFWSQKNINIEESLPDELLDEWMKFDIPWRIPLPDPITPLPLFIPISFFLDKDEGDSIRVSSKGRKVLLLCHQELSPLANSFREEFDQRLQYALSNDNINPKKFEQSKNLAKSRPHWISSD